MTRWSALLAHDSVRAALATLAVVGAVFLWVGVEAIRITPTVSAPIPSFDSAALRAQAADSAAPARSFPVANVIAQNLFAPDRSAPLRRYRLAGYASEEPVYVAEAARPVVQGTATGRDGRSFAMCTLNGSPTVVVRVGDKLGDYTVRKIDRGAVTFSAPSGEQFAVNSNPS